jgi:hypothetical protein
MSPDPSNCKLAEQNQTMFLQGNPVNFQSLLHQHNDNTVYNYPKISIPCIHHSHSIARRLVAQALGLV